MRLIDADALIEMCENPFVDFIDMDDVRNARPSTLCLSNGLKTTSSALKTTETHLRQYSTK